MEFRWKESEIMKAPNRLRMLPAVVLFAGLVLTPSFVSKSPAQDPDESESLVQRGFAINPVPLNLDGKNRALVGLGSYIVSGRGGCIGCHTCPTYVGPSSADNPFVSGGTLDELDTPGPVNKDNFLAGGVVFARPNGTFVSKNITPDPTEGNMPEGLTFEQFLTVMRTGHDPDQPGHILQVMIWPVLRHMTERDLRAVYEYLSAIPHAEPGTPPCAGADTFRIKQ
jgi:hypothetical protein